MDWQERIVSDPDILGGQPAIKGTRLAVAFILDRLADGESEAALLRAHQGLCSEDVRACLRYASQRIAPQKVSAISGLIAGRAIPHAAQAMLSKADERFQRYDYCGGSRALWETVEWSIKHVAAKRGWPCGSERELELVVERLGDETGDYDEKLTLIGGLQNAQALLDNAKHDGQCLSPSQTEFYAGLAPPFIERIFAAAAPD